MPQANIVDRNLAEAASRFKEVLQNMYPDIEVRFLSPLEDEDFAFEVLIPRNFSSDEVLEACHRECIEIEDEYDLFFFPIVLYKD